MGCNMSVRNLEHWSVGESIPLMIGLGGLFGLCILGKK